MSNNFLAGLLVLGIGVLVFMFVTVDTADPVRITREEARQEIATVTQEADMHQELKEGFMEGCLEEDGTVADCECMFNGLDRRLTDDQLVQFGLRMWDGTTTDADIDLMIDVVYDCL